MSGAQVVLLKAGQHHAEGTSDEKNPNEDVIAIFIRLSKPKPKPGRGTPDGTSTTTDVTNTETSDGKAFLEQRKEPPISVEIESEICSLLKPHVWTVKLEVGHGIMLEKKEVLCVFEDLFVLCTLHPIRPESLISAADDELWGPSSSWTPPADNPSS